MLFVFFHVQPPDPGGSISVILLLSPVKLCLTNALFLENRGFYDEPCFFKENVP